MADNFNKITSKGDQSWGKENSLVKQEEWVNNKILDLEDFESSKCENCRTS